MSSTSTRERRVPGAPRSTARPRRPLRSPRPAGFALERTLPPELRRALAAADWDALAPEGWYARRGRRLLDLALLAVLAPLAVLPLALVALVNLALFRDPRRVLFTQARVGWRGRVFTIYKFRTMREPRRSEHESWLAGEDHARVTGFGRFLRNAHLDELPQLFNILRGDMGFIGPRPEMIEIECWAAEHVPGFARRLAIRPGISGWAQITQGYTGHDARAYAQKLAVNDRYREELSFAKDVEIVLRTILWMVRGRGWSWKAGEGAAGDEAPAA